MVMAPVLTLGQAPTVMLESSPDWFMEIPSLVCLSGQISIEQNTGVDTLRLATLGFLEEPFNNTFPDDATTGTIPFNDPYYFNNPVSLINGESTGGIELSMGSVIINPNTLIPNGETVYFEFWIEVTASNVYVCYLQVKTTLFFWDGETPHSIVHCDAPLIMVINALGTPPDNEVGQLQYALSPNYPNPFNPTTTISFALPTATTVNLTVYDLSGRQVATLVNGWRVAGTHEVTFDGSNLASGVYTYRLQAGDFIANGKMALMK